MVTDQEFQIAQVITAVAGVAFLLSFRVGGAGAAMRVAVLGLYTLAVIAFLVVAMMR